MGLEIFQNFPEILKCIPNHSRPTRVKRVNVFLPHIYSRFVHHFHSAYEAEQVIHEVNFRLDVMIGDAC